MRRSRWIVFPFVVILVDILFLYIGISLSVYRDIKELGKDFVSQVIIEELIRWVTVLTIMFLLPATLIGLWRGRSWSRRTGAFALTLLVVMILINAITREISMPVDVVSALGVGGFVVANALSAIALSFIPFYRSAVESTRSPFEEPPPPEHPSPTRPPDLPIE